MAWDTHKLCKNIYTYDLTEDVQLRLVQDCHDNEKYHASCKAKLKILDIGIVRAPSLESAQKTFMDRFHDWVETICTAKIIEEASV